MKKGTKLDGKIPGSGRVKGTPNRMTQTLQEICEKHNFHPFEALLEIAKDVTHEHRFPALKEIAQYLYPKRKAIEVSQDIDEDFLAAAKQFNAMNKDELMKVIQAEIDAAGKGTK